MLLWQLDYEKREGWDRIIRSSSDDWDKNLETIIEWSPFSSEADLLRQVNFQNNPPTPPQKCSIILIPSRIVKLVWQILYKSNEKI